MLISLFLLAQGAVPARRFLDGNGTRPSIEALGPRSIAPHDSLLVFNPFVSWDELPARLAYRFVLKPGSDRNGSGWNPTGSAP